MSEKPTPGPWKLATEWSDEHGMRHDCAAVDADSGCVAECLRMDTPLALDQANARLIVAAVNACFAVNASDPQKVAAQIGAMVELARLAADFDPWSQTTTLRLKAQTILSAMEVKP